MRSSLNWIAVAALFVLTLCDGGCGKKEEAPSEELVKQAIRQECSTHLVAMGTELEIKNLKIGQFDTNGHYFPVYAEVGFEVPTGFLSAHSPERGYFQLRKENDNKWKAVWVEVKK